MSALVDFLTRAVAWPKPGDSGFVNMHWSVPDHKGMGGQPHKDIRSFLGGMVRCRDNPKSTKDVYFCLSQQAHAGQLSDGKLRAIRSAEDALYLSALWFDIDGNKEPPRGYSSKPLAIAGLARFIEAS